MRKPSTIRRDLDKAQIACDKAMRMVIAINNRMDIRLIDTINANPNHANVIAYNAACDLVAKLRDELRYNGASY